MAVWVVLSWAGCWAGSEAQQARTLSTNYSQLNLRANDIQKKEKKWSCCESITRAENCASHADNYTSHDEIISMASQ
jgi:hypothetical protein